MINIWIFLPTFLCSGVILNHSFCRSSWNPAETDSPRVLTYDRDSQKWFCNHLTKIELLLQEIAFVIEVKTPPRSPEILILVSCHTLDWDTRTRGEQLEVWQGWRGVIGSCYAQLSMSILAPAQLHSLIPGRSTAMQSDPLISQVEWCAMC